MRNVEMIFELIGGVFPRTRSVYRDGRHLKVYASDKISVSELRRLVEAYQTFGFNLSLVKYEVLPFRVLMTFEVEE